MKVDRASMRLYVVTDRTWLKEQSLEEQVETAIQGGATFIQLREKDLQDDALIQQALKIKRVTDRCNIPFVINDNVQVAIAVDADGVHVGQSDCSAKEVRRLIGPHKLLGVSVQTADQALIAQQAGADYIGVGAVFNTSTKQDAKTMSNETLKAICKAVNIPIVAIGGICEENVLELKGSGVDGIAVISAIFSKPDIIEAAKRLCKLSEQMVKR